jgi:hypothetical protein
MRRCGTVLLVGSILTALAVLVATGPVAAHPAARAAGTTATPAVGDLVSAPAEVEPPPSTTPGPTGARPGILAGVIVLAGVGAAAWRRPRHAPAVGLALLLTVFVFENALHSVHHGFDAKQSTDCPVAAASAHLAALSVESLSETAFVRIVAGTPAAPDAPPPAIRRHGPDQDRAPPVPTA